MAIQEGVALELFLFARFHARPGCSEALRQAIRKVQDPTRLEVGCISYNAYHSVRDADEFYVHSRWVDQTAFDQHARFAHTEAFLAEVEPLIDHPVTVSLTMPLPE